MHAFLRPPIFSPKQFILLYFGLAYKTPSLSRPLFVWFVELGYSNGNLKDNSNVYFFSGRARLAAEPLRHRSQFPDILPKPQPKSTDIKLSPQSLHKEDTTLGEMVYVNNFTRFFHFLKVD